jgi:hypothetical protein
VRYDGVTVRNEAMRERTEGAAYLRSCIMFVAKKLKTHRVIMTGHSYGGMIVSLITESLIRNGIDDLSHVRTTASIYIPKHRYFVCRHHSLPLDWRPQATATVTAAPCSSKMPSNSGQQTKFTQDGYVYWGVTNESEHFDQTSTMGKSSMVYSYRRPICPR